MDEFRYCGMEMGYAEGSSWHAYEGTDWVYLGGRHDRAEERLLEIMEMEEEVVVQEKKESKTGVLRNMQKETEELEEEFLSAAHTAETLFEEEHADEHFSAKDYSFEMGFGCQYKITGLFKSQLADGIMVSSIVAAAADACIKRKRRSRKLKIAFTNAHSLQ